MFYDDDLYCGLELEDSEDDWMSSVNPICLKARKKLMITVSNISDLEKDFHPKDLRVMKGVLARHKSKTLRSLKCKPTSFIPYGVFFRPHMKKLILKQ